MEPKNMSRGVAVLGRLWGKLPEDIRQSAKEAVVQGLDTTLVVFSARLATTDFAQKHESFVKLLGKITGHLRDRLHGGE